MVENRLSGAFIKQRSAICSTDGGILGLKLRNGGGN
jgi:hypothetical protein